MDTILTWIGEHPGFLGYMSGALIFFITLVCLGKQLINFLMALLFLFFSLLAGFTIAHNQKIASCLTAERSTNSEPEFENDTSENLQS